MRIQTSVSNQPNINYGISNPVSKTAAEDLTVDKAVQAIPQKLNITSAITIATLASVIGILMLSRGFQKNTNLYLNKFKMHLQEKLAMSSLNGATKRKKFYEYSIKKVDNFIKKSESINNITSLKDVLFMKLMYKTEPTKKIHKSITDYFEKISLKTVHDSYQKTEKKFERMNKIFDKLDEQILKDGENEIVEYKNERYTKKELIELAKTHRESANLIVNNFMSKNSINERYKYMNEVTSTLYSKFWDASFKDFWSKNNKFKRKEMWQSFIAAEQIKGDKTELVKWINMARNAISYTNRDRIGIIYEYIKKFYGIIPPEDKEGIKIIKKLEWYTIHSEVFRNNKEFFLTELAKLKEHKIPVTTDANLVQTREKWKSTYVGLIEDFADENATGAVQDMLDIYYKIAPLDLAKTGASLSVKEAVKSFDKSVNLECVELFDKIRDLRLGSAPTDILTILLSFVTLSFGLGYAKDKDQRKSIMLKSGIPVAGAIATATYSASRLVSGGKSLALGFISGIVLNQLGIIADNIKKNRNLMQQSEK